MCVVAIDPTNRTRIVRSKIRVFSLLGRAIRVLVGRGRVIISGGMRVLTGLVGLLVVPTILASAKVLLALVTLVVLVLWRVFLGVNLSLGSRWILSLRRCWSRLRWIIWRWRLRCGAGCGFAAGVGCG